MFLSEGYVNTNEEVSADPIYAMQIMQEATDDWNDICMKMVKLEHTAIMREDAELLAEGAKEALTRFKNNVVVLGKKLIEYLERVRVQWSKLQASIASKFVNTDAINALKKNYESKQTAGIKGSRGKLEVTITSGWTDAVSTVTSMSAATLKVTDLVTKDAKSGEYSDTNTTVGGAKGYMDKYSNVGKGLTDSDESLNEKVDRILAGYKFKEAETEQTVDLTWNHVKDAIDFLKKRPIAIKNIETMKKAVTQVQNALISEMDKTEKPQAKNTLVILQRAFNSMIIKINKYTTTAVKICNAVKGEKGYTGIDARDKSKAFERGKTITKVKNESVLDLF